MSNKTITFTDMGIKDVLYDEAVRIVLTDKRSSISHIQRKLRIGYHRAARLIEAIESQQIISAIKANGTRTILIDLESYDRQADNNKKLMKSVLNRINPIDLTQQIIWEEILNSLDIDLEKLNNFDDFNFAHDIFGIRKHYDIYTRTLSNHFLPRSTKSNQ